MRPPNNLSNGWTDGIRTLIEGVLLKEFLTNVNYSDFQVSSVTRVLQAELLCYDTRFLTQNHTEF
jgi:hypothetical protein